MFTHRVTYEPDRIERSRYDEQMEAMIPQPRQISLKTLLLITTLLGVASAATAAVIRHEARLGAEVRTANPRP